MFHKYSKIHSKKTAKWTVYIINEWTKFKIINFIFAPLPVVSPDFTKWPIWWHNLTIDFSRHAFQFSAPSVWNSLVQTVLISDSLSVFKSRPKTFLFNQAFTEHWSDMLPAPLKLRPYGTVEIWLLLLLLSTSTWPEYTVSFKHLIICTFIYHVVHFENSHTHTSTVFVTICCKFKFYINI